MGIATFKAANCDPDPRTFRATACRETEPIDGECLRHLASVPIDFRKPEETLVESHTGRFCNLADLRCGLDPRFVEVEEVEARWKRQLLSLPCNTQVELSDPNSAVGIAAGSQL
ncbi:MAG: hypothetical protein MEQ84_07520 [Mesorhizobium sp.]|nr:hypothetical protein [Mesorhizobium sp.]